MENVQDFLDFHAENNNGMTREEFTAYYLSEKKEQKLTSMALIYNEDGGKLYKAVFKYNDGSEQKLRSEDIDFIEEIINKVFGLKVSAANIRDIDKHESELLKVSKKLKIDFEVAEYDL